MKRRYLRAILFAIKESEKYERKKDVQDLNNNL